MADAKRARDAVTGRFVTIAYALLNPARTVIERIKKRKKP